MVMYPQGVNWYKFIMGDCCTDQQEKPEREINSIEKVLCEQSLLQLVGSFLNLEEILEFRKVRLTCFVVYCKFAIS